VTQVLPETTAASAAGNAAKLPCKGVRREASPDLLCGLSSIDGDGAGAAVAVNVNDLRCGESALPGVVLPRLGLSKSPCGARLQDATGVQDAMPEPRCDASPPLGETCWNEVTGVLLIGRAAGGGPTGHGGTEWLSTAASTSASIKHGLRNASSGGSGGGTSAGIDGGG